ncbi:DUF3179 domain-containing protein [Halanaerobium sp. ST460_2HS_T2]|uniref:DUF3179 domain-containing protein n=1 Tax=Halanaerobium sp. ST460_2HS_T2 TaxID=2183914 RepID=UPI000DF1B041|nr:DUF3179 domain-containing protein [Halanaerobium sp. ST460_2HS_T2]RCW52107.1 uncharacterized protein DUF3179 [Halanaerobium sp. ST460_2HS_T2]
MFILLLIFTLTGSLQAQDQNKIELLADNIVSGGPAPDGIPPLENPQYISIEEANNYLNSEDAVFVLETEGEVFIYPQRIMVWHEIVNEEVAGEKMSITYCPLTGSAIGYYSKISSEETTLGTSGKLVNSNLIMYDRANESYWPQIFGTAITEPAKGERLERFPVIWSKWKLVQAKYDQAQVLSTKTGYSRDYDRDPYGSYRESGEDEDNYYTNSDLIFPVLAQDDTLAPKEVVIAGEYKNINFAILKNLLRMEEKVEFDIEAEQFTARYDSNLDTVKVFVKEEDELIEVVVYDVMWFAWHAYFPEAIENLVY